MITVIKESKDAKDAKSAQKPRFSGLFSFSQYHQSSHNGAAEFQRQFLKLMREDKIVEADALLQSLYTLKLFKYEPNYRHGMNREHFFQGESFSYEELHKKGIITTPCGLDIADKLRSRIQDPRGALGYPKYKKVCGELMNVAVVMGRPDFVALLHTHGLKVNLGRLCSQPALSKVLCAESESRRQPIGLEQYKKEQEQYRGALAFSLSRGYAETYLHLDNDLRKALNESSPNINRVILGAHQYEHLLDQKQKHHPAFQPFLDCQANHLSTGDAVNASLAQGLGLKAYAASIPDEPYLMRYLRLLAQPHIHLQLLAEVLSWCETHMPASVLSLMMQYGTFNITEDFNRAADLNLQQWRDSHPELKAQSQSSQEPTDVCSTFESHLSRTKGTFLQKLDFVCQDLNPVFQKQACDAALVLYTEREAALDRWTGTAKDSNQQVSAKDSKQGTEPPESDKVFKAMVKEVVGSEPDPTSTSGQLTFTGHFINKRSKNPTLYDQQSSLRAKVREWKNLPGTRKSEGIMKPLQLVVEDKTKFAGHLRRWNDSNQQQARGKYLNTLGLSGEMLRSIASSGFLNSNVSFFQKAPEQPKVVAKTQSPVATGTSVSVTQSSTQVSQTESTSQAASTSAASVSLSVGSSSS